jgi:hypothetical protein
VFMWRSVGEAGPLAAVGERRREGAGGLGWVR